jgi:hypothetical protein
MDSVDPHSIAAYFTFNSLHVENVGGNGVTLRDSHGVVFVAPRIVEVRGSSVVLAGANNTVLVGGVLSGVGYGKYGIEIGHSPSGRHPDGNWLIGVRLTPEFVGIPNPAGRPVSDPTKINLLPGSGENSMQFEERQNTRGSLVISGADPNPLHPSKPAKSVLFASPEPDPSYFVVATVSDISGAGLPAGAMRVHVTNKIGAGFTMHLEKWPGVGNSVKVDWILLR